MIQQSAQLRLSQLPYLYSPFFFLYDPCRQQTLRYGARIVSETVTHMELQNGPPFKVRCTHTC